MWFIRGINLARWNMPHPRHDRLPSWRAGEQTRHSMMWQLAMSIQTADLQQENYVYLLHICGLMTCWCINQSFINYYFDSARVLCLWCKHVLIFMMFLFFVDSYKLIAEQSLCGVKWGWKLSFNTNWQVQHVRFTWQSLNPPKSARSQVGPRVVRPPHITLTFINEH